MSLEKFQGIDSEKRSELNETKNSINPDIRIGDIVRTGFSKPEYNETELKNENKGLEIIKDNDLIEKKDANGIEKTSKEVENEDKPIREIKTINQALEGNNHPETGVPFVRKTIDVYGEKVEGVFPVFESKFDTFLPPDKLKASDNVQFKACIEDLRKAIEEDPSLAGQFTDVQLQQIKNGEPRIKGLTWHHSEEVGKMQLVNSEIHLKTNHTGGAVIWGGRNE